MSIEILDPTHEGGSAAFSLAERVDTLEGATVAVISNGKRGVKPFFDVLETELVNHHGVAKVVRLTKSNYSAPAEPELLSKADEWQALIAGVGD